MNVAITRAAEGFPCRAFSVDDISRMIEASDIGDDENFELIEGDLVVMAAKHVGRDGIKNALGYGAGEESARRGVGRNQMHASACK